MKVDQTLQIYDEAMKILIDEMYDNRRLCTWTSIEPYDKYVSYGVS